MNREDANVELPESPLLSSPPETEPLNLWGSLEFSKIPVRRGSGDSGRYEFSSDDELSLVSPLEKNKRYSASSSSGFSDRGSPVLQKGFDDDRF